MSLITRSIVSPRFAFRLNFKSLPFDGFGKITNDFVVYDMGFGFGSPNISVVQEIAAEAPSLPLMPGTYRLKLKITNMMRGQFVYALEVIVIGFAGSGPFQTDSIFACVFCTEGNQFYRQCYS